VSALPTILVIGGPTATGKTALALDLAEQFGTSIISADSRQCYRELNIGVARPSMVELARIPHYFIGTHSVTEPVNAAAFAGIAREAAADVSARNRAAGKPDLVVLAGGTGLYIKAFTEGIDLIPPVPEGVRRAVQEGYEQGGLGWLQAQVRLKDPAWLEGGEGQNPRRLMRALEVFDATGRPIKAFQGKIRHGYNVLKIGLELPRPLLYERIDARVDRMMEAGLLEEVRGLLPYMGEKALDTVGYKELFDYLQGLLSLEEAVARIKQHSRNYAKRQLTWFKKDRDFRWFGPEQGAAVLADVQQRLSAF
jgi:tRNA dimethylallyltransferase